MDIDDGDPADHHRRRRLTQFPSTNAFASLARSLPDVLAVLLFAAGIFACAAGVVLVVLGVRNLRRRWHRLNQIARHASQSPQYDDEGWGPAYR